MRSPPSPQRIAFVGCLLSLATCVLCTAALAHVGATSSGVVTNDPTQPSANVQQQSSDFVAANAQLAANANTPGNHANGSTTGTAVVAGTVNRAGQNANAAGSTAAGENGKTGQKNAPPPPPPAPPPVYHSVIHSLDRPSSDEDAKATAPAAQPQQHEPQATPQPEGAAASSPPPVALNRTKPKPEEAAPIKVPAYQPDPGGHGKAPDGYTFPLGLLIAGALLIFGLSTYLRIGRSESPRNRGA